MDNTDDKYSAEFRENAERVKKAIGEFEANSAAIMELSDAYHEDWEMRRLQQGKKSNSAVKASSIPAVYGGVLQRLGRWLGVLPVTDEIVIPESGGPTRYSVLAENISENISEKTKERLAAIGSSPDKIEASFAIIRLEEKNRKIVDVLNFTPNGTIENQFGRETVDGADSTTAGVYEDPAGFFGKPGECSSSAKESPIIEEVYSDEEGRYHSLNVGELQIVKQKLIGYEIGEIAHIENVMKNEKRSRNHRTLHRTEEFTSFEFESGEETERDVQTTTRFELQKEINRDVRDISQKEAGLTVSGKYGPTVEFSASANVAVGNSSANSTRLSNSYSKEVVDRSVQRIQEKIKEKRTLLTIDEVEVINRHAFINRSPESMNVNGIYRWVNKLYEARLFNYGVREIVEVVIPEPAALVRYLALSHPKGATSIPKPLKPGYCRSGKFTPLSVGTVTEFNYLDWVTAYNIQDVEPPPASFVLRSTAYDEDVLKIVSEEAGTLFPYASFADTSFKIDPGYQAKRAWLTVNQTNIFTHGEISIGRTSTTVNYGGIVSGVPQLPDLQPKGSIEVQLSNEDEILPIAISLRFTGVFSATIEVECQRTTKALIEWKISTYSSIMNRYAVLMEEYEEAISGEDNFGGVDIQGKNPIENKNAIASELKRQAITQMTGQTFDGFDAMREAASPQEFPQQDVDEAWREGQYVRFVEQAFEWENMQYLLYPYFWGKKTDWPVTSQLEDTDPLFRSFLQAGYCRVNIPIRPGFVDATNTFLSTGKIPWDSKYDGPVVTEPVIEEEIDPFLSITDEMQAQQGAVYFKSEGTVSHVAGDPEAVLTGNVIEDVNEEGRIVLIPGTNFVKDDENREVNIAGKIYMVVSVDEEQQKITIDDDIAQLIQGNVQYGIGAKAIGVPWMVRIPTSLVILHEGDQLPDIPE